MLDHNKIYVINFADSKFEEQRKFNSYTAKTYGEADFVIEYSPHHIDKDFIDKNFEILSEKRGVGLWLWKPYIIKKTLEIIPENSYLFYSDAGSFFISSIKNLIQDLDKSNQEIMVFELPLLERQWTKKETFTTLNYDYYDNNQIMATFILCKNTAYVRNFIDKWLFHSQDKRCIMPYNITNESNLEDFVEHREDQSILSILCHKEKIIPFRDPSQYGKRPYEYAWKTRFLNRWIPYCYKEKRHSNSRYPQILISTRGANLKWIKKHEKYVELLRIIGIYNKWTYKLKYHAQYK